MNIASNIKRMLLCSVQEVKKFKDKCISYYGVLVSVNIDHVKAIIDNIVMKGAAYVVGLHVFLHSSHDYDYENVVRTLKPAFGESVAKKVYSEIKEAFKDINLYTEINIEGKEEWLKDYLKKYILEERISKTILEEIEKRFKQIPEGERKILSIACAIINTLKNKKYPAVSILTANENFIEVHSSDREYFSKVVSSTLDFDILDVRALFYKYLLGFQSDSASRKYDYYTLKIYPFVTTYIERLASEAKNYIKVLDKSDVKSRLSELYQKRDFLKLSVIQWALRFLPEDITDILTAGTPKFLSYFFGIPYEQLYKSVVIKGIINKGFVNPLVYDYVQEVIDALYEEALKELIGLFRDVFERAGYASICVDECCTFTKALTKPIYICFSPWPKDIYVRDAPEDAKAIVLQGLPSQSILQYLQTYDPKGFVWLFVEKGRIAVASNTYRSEAHQELLKILSNNFSIEFIGTTPEKLRESEEVIKTSKALTTAPATQPLTMPRIRRFGSRDVLEDVVASVLDTLGFSIRVDLKIASRSGTEVEVDVLGEKIVGDTRFMVYASCKN